jgi:hypothetical protein
VDTSKIESGQQLTMLTNALRDPDSRVETHQPDYARNAYRFVSDTLIEIGTDETQV